MVAQPAQRALDSLERHLDHIRLRLLGRVIGERQARAPLGREQAQQINRNAAIGAAEAGAPEAGGTGDGAGWASTEEDTTIPATNIRSLFMKGSIERM